MVQKVAIPLHSLLRNSDAMAAATAMIEKGKSFCISCIRGDALIAPKHPVIFYIIYCLGHLSHRGIGFSNTL